MSAKPMSTLLRKEIREAGWAALLGTILMALLIQARLTNPEDVPNVFWFGGLACLAFTVGYQQTRRESRGDMWAFALHRPASTAQIFGAKVIVGMGGLLIGTVIAIIAIAWWISVPGHQGAVAGRSYWPAIADCFALLTYQSAGLYAGVARGGTMRRAVGLAIAVFGTWAELRAPNAGWGIAATVVCAAVVTAGAWWRFTRPELEAQRTSSS
jgi:hypothetical protein